MDFQSAIRGLVGNTEMIAILPGGPVLVASRRGGVRDVRNGRPRHYVGKIGDWLSIEWILQTREQAEIAVRKQLRELQEAEAAEAAGQGNESDS